MEEIIWRRPAANLNIFGMVNRDKLRQNILGDKRIQTHALRL
jgi:hypothetical protein